MVNLVPPWCRFNFPNEDDEDDDDYYYYHFERRGYQSACGLWGPGCLLKKRIFLTKKILKKGNVIYGSERVL